MPTHSEQFAALDQSLTKLFMNFEALANELNFQVICELSDDTTIEKQNYPGIYKIDIKNHGIYENVTDWIKWFKDNWEHDDYHRKFTPNTKKKRIAAHSKLEEWIPLYIGKSNNIAGRVWEHNNLQLEKPTSALKLRERKNMARHTFRLSTICIKVDNYDLIMPRIEQFLRDRHNPILGRQ
jgi:hypothetical protein